MIGSIILGLPAITCLLCLLMTKLKKNDSTSRQFSLVMVFATLYFFDFAIRNSTDVNPTLSTAMHLLMQWNTMSLVAAIVVYLFSLYRTNYYHTWMVVFYMPAIVQGTLATFLFFTSQSDKSLIPFYIYVSDLQFHIVTMLWLIVLIIFTIIIGRKMGIGYGNIYRFFFKARESTTEKVIVTLCHSFMFLLLLSAAPAIGTPDTKQYITYAIAVLLAINIFYLGYVNFVHRRGTPCTYDSLTHMTINGGTIKITPQICPGAQEYQTDDHDLPDSSTDKDYAKPADDTAQTSSMMSKTPVATEISDSDRLLFEALSLLMQKEMLFIDQNISLDTLAMRLNTNRTYISRVINKFYQISFRDYVNLCRIEYSMLYMRENPNANQEQVAMRCGFPNAPSFSRKFHELVGKTPRQWVSECKG